MGWTFSRAWFRFNVFPRLAQVSRFPALGTGLTFSRAWHRFNFFPRLVWVGRFPALVTGWTIVHSWHGLSTLAHVLIASLRYLPALWLDRNNYFQAYPARLTLHIEKLTVSCLFPRLRGRQMHFPLPCAEALIFLQQHQTVSTTQSTYPLTSASIMWVYSQC